MFCSALIDWIDYLFRAFLRFIQWLSQWTVVYSALVGAFLTPIEKLREVATIVPSFIHPRWSDGLTIRIGETLEDRWYGWGTFGKGAGALWTGLTWIADIYKVWHEDGSVLRRISKEIVGLGVNIAIMFGGELLAGVAEATWPGVVFIFLGALALGVVGEVFKYWAFKAIDLDFGDQIQTEYAQNAVDALVNFGSSSGTRGPYIYYRTVSALVAVVAAIGIGIATLPAGPSTSSTSGVAGQSAGQGSSASSNVPSVPRDEVNTGNATVSGVQESSSDPDWEAALQRERLKAITSGDMAKYNRLIEKHRQIYQQRGVDPCGSHWFPQGCS